MPAVIENSEGEKIPFSGTCSFGRTPSNTVALTDNGVSRRHAIIHYQDGGDYLLVDLGSTNGTMLNGRYLDPIRKAFRACGLRFSATGGPAYGWQVSGFRLPALPMSRY